MQSELGKSQTIPPFIFCPRCGQRIMLKPLSVNEAQAILFQGYEDGARGICRCGVVLVICYQSLPKSPTFSIFIDVYKLSQEVYEMLSRKD